MILMNNELNSRPRFSDLYIGKLLDIVNSQLNILIPTWPYLVVIFLILSIIIAYIDAVKRFSLNGLSTKLPHRKPGLIHGGTNTKTF